MLVDHLIYAPVPFKGYTVRAKTKQLSEAEFKDVTKDWFVPFEEHLFSEYVYEASVVNIPPQSKKLYLSRIYRRQKLDDLGRDGQVCHMAAVGMENLVPDGVSIRDLNEAMVEFEQHYGTPIGEIPQIDIQCKSDSGDQPGKKQTDPDLANMGSLISKDQAMKIIKFLSEGNSDTKVYILCKRSYRDRIELVYALAKFLHRAGMSSLTLTSECPMELILNYYANLVISDYLPKLKPNSNWKVVNLTPKDLGEDQQSDSKKINDIFTEIYGR